MSSSSEGDNYSSSSSSSATPFTFTDPPVLIAFTLAAIGSFFACFVLVYLLKYCVDNMRRCWTFHRAANSLVRRRRNSSTNDNNGITSPPYRGLPLSRLQSYNTFIYSIFKDLQPDQILECPICLVEFGEDSMVRLMRPRCHHVFHQICIDHWLSSNKTCPVCRTDLDYTSPNSTNCQFCGHRINERSSSRDDNTGDHVCIDIKLEGDDDDDDDDDNDGNQGRLHDYCKGRSPNEPPGALWFSPSSLSSVRSQNDTQIDAPGRKNEPPPASPSPARKKDQIASRTMYLKVQLPWNVIVSAENLQPGSLMLQRAIVIRLLSDFAVKKATKDIGYFLAVTTLEKIGEGKVRQLTGDVLFPVVFNAITFKIFKGEILEGVVHKVLKHGVFMRIGPIENAYLSSSKMPGYEYIHGENAYFMNQKMPKLAKDVRVRVVVIGTKWMEAEREFQALVGLEGDYLGPISADV